MSSVEQGDAVGRRMRNHQLGPGQLRRAVRPLVVHQLARGHVDDLPPDGGNGRRIGIWYGVAVLPVARAIFEDGPGVCNRLPEELIIGQAVEALAQPPIGVFEHGRQQRYP